MKSEFKTESFLNKRHSNRMLISFNSIMLYLILQAYIVFNADRSIWILSEKKETANKLTNYATVQLKL